MGNLEPESVRDFVTLGFVDFNNRVFFALIGNRFSRAYAGPIENVQVIKPGFRHQKLPSFHRSFGRQVRRFLDQ